MNNFSDVNYAPNNSYDQGYQNPQAQMAINSPSQFADYIMPGVSGVAYNTAPNYDSGVAYSVGVGYSPVSAARFGYGESPRQQMQEQIIQRELYINATTPRYGYQNQNYQNYDNGYVPGNQWQPSNQWQSGNQWHGSQQWHPRQQWQPDNQWRPDNSYQAWQNPSYRYQPNYREQTPYYRQEIYSTPGYDTPYMANGIRVTPVPDLERNLVAGPYGRRLGAPVVAREPEYVEAPRPQARPAEDCDLTESSYQPTRPAQISERPAQPDAACERVPEQKGDQGGWSQYDWNVYNNLEKQAQALVGHNIQEYDKSVPIRLGCARAVSLLVEKGYGFPVHDQAIHNLEKDLKGKGFTQVSINDMKPGDVICGYREAGDYPHGAVYMGNGKIFNNDSDDGIMEIQSIAKYNKSEFKRFVILRRPDTVPSVARTDARTDADSDTSNSSSTNPAGDNTQNG